MAKRLIFSTATPNDQGGVIPNEVIDFARYNKNPVLLKEHRWSSDPLGVMTDIRLLNGEWSGIPVFHLATQESREAAAMYEAGSLNASSIGGEALWKKSPITDDYVRDAQGLKHCQKFFLYEISLVSLPSNPDAVGVSQFAAIKFYEDSGAYEEMDRVMVSLSSKFNLQQMLKKGDPGYVEPVVTEPVIDPAAKPAATPEPVTLGANTDINELPPVIRQAIKNGMSVTFSSVPAQTDKPVSTVVTGVPGDPQPEPIGVKGTICASKLKAMHRAQFKAEECVEKADKAKKKAEADDATEEEKASASRLNAEALAAVDLAAKAEEEYKAAKEEADDEEMSAKSKVPGAVPARATMSAQPQSTGTTHAPQLKDAATLRETLRLAAVPSFKATVLKASEGVTFTRLNSAKASEDDKKLLKRVFHADKKTTDQVSVQDHAIVLNSILNDSRLRAIVEKTRIMTGVTEGQMQGMMANPRGQRGMNLLELSADMAAGRVQYQNRSGGMDNLTLLTTTDQALASPALNTIEWLSLAIFELFPTTSWKASIPMFAAAIGANNTGTIWANIAAEPAIYKGTSPAPAGDYVYSDNAVSLALTPYWLQPMLWNPLTMHQLRYDQMSTGWAQAFAKWNAVIDDNLIYTLASTVPAGSIIPTSGLSGYQQAPMAFNIPASGAQNKFYWNPNFAGSLLYPTLNDIIAVEQVYRNQNFELEREKGVLIIDPIMERYFSQDPETKSLLTRWIDSNGEEFKGFKHTQLDTRSRVAIYDPATGQVKDINAGIPGTAVSAALGFIPSQIGMALGMLDVFSVQDPGNYGQRMSADIRIGVAPLRYNFYGTSLMVYGASNV